MKKKTGTISPYLQKIIELKKKHGDFIKWTTVGREVGTTHQNARQLYERWLKRKLTK